MTTTLDRKRGARGTEDAQLGSAMRNKSEGYCKRVDREGGEPGWRRTMVPTSSGVPGSTLQADWAELDKDQWALSAVY